MVRLTDRPDMTLDVYRGRETTTQQQQLMRLTWAMEVITDRRFIGLAAAIQTAMIRGGAVTSPCPFCYTTANTARYRARAPGTPTTPSAINYKTN